MVFVKFHNMKQEKKISNVTFKLKQLTNFHFTTSQNNIAITIHKCSAFFFFFFIRVLSIFLKNVHSFLSFFFICCVQQCSSFLFFLPCPFPLSCTFFFSFFFHNKLLTQYPFFFFFFKPYLCLSLSLPSFNNYRFASQFIQFQPIVP